MQTYLLNKFDFKVLYRKRFFCGFYSQKTTCLVLLSKECSFLIFKFFSYIHKIMQLLVVKSFKLELILSSI
jgi:hypothetical protein